MSEALSLSEEIQAKFTTEKGKLCQRLTFDEILDSRDEVREKLLELLIDLRRGTDLDDINIGPDKDLDVARKKARRDYNGDMARVTDYVRAKGIVTTPEEVTEIRKHLSLDEKGRGSDLLNDHGIHVIRDNNYFADPIHVTGYRCINYKLGIPVGDEGKLHVVELQIVAEQLEAIYDDTHPHKRAAEDIMLKDGFSDDIEARRESAAHFAYCRLGNGIAARDSGYDSLLLPSKRSKAIITETRRDRLDSQIRNVLDL